ncbi:MAG: hypothetical protein SFV52_12770 [Saprospiraceae bacterium]|nr:hypothetical protein [Saprospiraceae bacterium]
MRYSIIAFLLIVLGAYRLASCSGDAGASHIGPHAPDRPMPKEATDSVQLTFSDVHYWSEAGYFNVVGLANNTDYRWRRMWVRITPLDAGGQPLSVDKQPGVVVPVMADAVPPRGRSSFFASIPLDKIDGTPADCRLGTAGVTEVESGPILIPAEISGVRILVHPEGGGEPRETGWTTRVSVTNPLPFEARHPCLEALVYGKDGKLWYSQLLDPLVDSTVVMQEYPGPIPAEGSKWMAFNISYQGLPQALRDSLIRNVDIQCFNKRD